MIKFKILLILAVICLCAGIPSARTWQPDSLAGYEYTRIERADGGRCTVIRQQATCGNGRGVLYVHGYNDYFFQKEEGDTFVDSCYSFYAVDLHGYGRSILPGERPYQTHSISDYYADIDSALSIMKEDGVDRIALMGHSTGGLITASYMTFAPSPSIDALILNSPFLEFNMNGFMRGFMVPVMGCIGAHFPGIAIPQADDTAYGESCSADFHGEWRYNYAWKTLHPRSITTGWLHMIKSAQTSLRKNPERILVPILLMHSDNSVTGSVWTPAHQQGDAVLKVSDIEKYGRCLGPCETELTVHGGMHDLFLSAPDVRKALYAAVFKWLETKTVLGNLVAD